MKYRFNLTVKKEPDMQKLHRSDIKVCFSVFFRIKQPYLYQLPEPVAVFGKPIHKNINGSLMLK